MGSTGKRSWQGSRGRRASCGQGAGTMWGRWMRQHQNGHEGTGGGVGTERQRRPSPTGRPGEMQVSTRSARQTARWCASCRRAASTLYQPSHWGSEGEGRVQAGPVHKVKAGPGGWFNTATEEAGAGLQVRLEAQVGLSKEAGCVVRVQ